MLDSCLHFQQTHRQQSLLIRRRVLESWRMEVGDSHVFAFLSPPRQTSGSVAAQVHQLDALTASAGCFGSTRLDLSGDFLGGAVGYDADEGESGQ